MLGDTFLALQVSSQSTYLTVMPAENPYQPPQSSLESDFKVTGAMGYRDGGHLLVRDGFVAPFICVKTGDQVEQDSSPETISLKSSVKWKMILGGIFVVFMGIGLFQLPSIVYLSPLIIPIGVFGVFWGVSSVSKTSMGVVTIFCNRELRKKRNRLRGFSSIINIVGLLCIVFHDSLFSGRVGVSGLIVLIIVNHFSGPRKLLKSLGREGDYERFQGAHPNFLAALPSTSILESKKVTCD